MWQSDIFTFRLGGKNAYLIGFKDDYSRYVVGLDVFRSQTADHVLEVYRTAVAEYGVPKEMLTDQGRQYCSWRGTTRFEQELAKDRVHHIKSRPHHPMTKGKIERFWKTIWEEFLVRAQFESFEQARERIRLWVKYYNHKRPHQGIGGLCPADRFFEIARELRQVIEKGVAENVLELALRGQPQSPFYMVGRLGQQSVVIRAEKGQVKMLIDGEENESAKEVTYNLKGEQNHDLRKQIQNGEQVQQGADDLQRTGAGTGGVERVDGAPPTGRGVQGAVHQRDGVEPLAEAGAGGHAGIVGTTDTAGAGMGPGFGHEAGEDVVAKSAGKSGSCEPVGETAGQTPGTEGTIGGGAGPEVIGEDSAEAELNENESTHGSTASPIPAACGDGLPSAERPADGQGSSPETGPIPQDLLQVGEANPVLQHGGGVQAAPGPAGEGGRSEDAGPGTTEPATGAQAAGVGADGEDPATVGLRLEKKPLSERRES